jgi:predicted dinucleotide-binding enzyme
MRIAVLGTGGVGQTLATRLVELGHDVVMGARVAGNPKAVEWAGAHQSRAGTFADAAAHGEIVINATAGTASLAALTAAGADNLAGKVLVDVANALDFSHGFPPSLSVAITDSLAEQIQRTFPDTRVVKALNTVTAAVMVHPEQVPGEHNLFIAGNDESAKKTVTALLGEFGWPAGRVMDLGGVPAARGMEAYILLWLSIMQTSGGAIFNVRVLRGTDT